MLYKRATLLFLPVLLTAAAGEPSRTPAGEEIPAKARAIHRHTLTLDSHVDIAGAQYATQELDPGIENPRLQCDLVKMEKGGLDGVFLVVYVGQGKRDAEGYRQAYEAAMTKFEAIQRLVKTMYPDRCELATSPDDVRRIVKAGKRAIMIGMENGYPIGTDLANLKKFYELGARYVTLSHNGHNQICDSAIPKPKLGDRRSEHDGLSPFGKKVVAEMNRLGMMADVSHIAPKSFWNLIEVSRAPLIASHSGCRALNDHPRNLDDQQIKALARGGGVIQIVALGAYLKAVSPKRPEAISDLARELGIPLGRGGPALKKASARQREQFRQGMKKVDKLYPLATIEDYLDHIDHAVKVAGIDHVGIGSDFDGGAGIPGFKDHRDAPNVTAGLLRRGYSQEQIGKIWGGNLLRVWRDVERVAAGLHSAGVN